MLYQGMGGASDMLGQQYAMQQYAMQQRAQGLRDMMYPPATAPGERNTSAATAPGERNDQQLLLLVDEI